MRNLTDEELVKVYTEAKKLGLDPKFIQLIALEMKQRQIDIDKSKKQK